MKGVPLKGRKGQITVFVIIALVIIVLGLFVYFFFPGVKTNTNPLQENPQEYFRSCVQATFKENVKTIAMQGGSINPSPSINYNGEKIEILCYTNQPYGDSPTIKCVPQRALLIDHIQSEIKNSMKQKVSECLQSMGSDYTGKGYTVNLTVKDFDIELITNKISPYNTVGKVVLHDNSTLVLTKGSTNKYVSFDVILNNNLFELATISKTIVAWEVAYGEADPIYFMAYYNNLNIKKVSPDGGKTAVWIIKDNDTGDVFQFASSEINWPLGIPTPVA